MLQSGLSISHPNLFDLQIVCGFYPNRFCHEVNNLNIGHDSQQKGFR